MSSNCKGYPKDVNMYHDIFNFQPILFSGTHKGNCRHVTWRNAFEIGKKPLCSVWLPRRGRTRATIGNGIQISDAYGIPFLFSILSSTNHKIYVNKLPNKANNQYVVGVVSPLLRRLPPCVVYAVYGFCAN